MYHMKIVLFGTKNIEISWALLNDPTNAVVPTLKTKLEKNNDFNFQNAAFDADPKGAIMKMLYINNEHGKICPTFMITQ